MRKPIVTTLCGSTRFPEAFALANMHLSLAGRIVIGLSMFGHADKPEGARFLTSDGDENTPEKQALDQLHFRKIDVSDGIFVVNPGYYVGSSTKREIDYALAKGKTVEWLFQPAVSLSLPAPGGWRNDPAIEVEAQRIYEGWSDQGGFVPWVPRGNSSNQEEARRRARISLSRERTS